MEEFVNIEVKKEIIDFNEINVEANNVQQPIHREDIEMIAVAKLEPIETTEIIIETLIDVKSEELEVQKEEICEVVPTKTHDFSNLASKIAESSSKSSKSTVISEVPSEIIQKSSKKPEKPPKNSSKKPEVPQVPSKPVKISSTSTQKVFKCHQSSCDHEFYTKVELTHHMKSTGHIQPEIIAKRSFFCHCGNFYFSHSDLNEHIRVTHNARFKCNSCGKVTFTEKSCQAHILRAHAGGFYTVGLLTRDGDLFRCPICKQDFESYRDYKEHADGIEHYDNATHYYDGGKGKDDAKWDCDHSSESSSSNAKNMQKSASSEKAAQIVEKNSSKFTGSEQGKEKILHKFINRIENNILFPI